MSRQENPYNIHTNPQPSPRKLQRSPYLGPPSQAHFAPHNGSNYFSSPPPAGPVGPHTGGYSFPAPLPRAYYGPPPGPQQQQMLYGPSGFQQQGMPYMPPPQPPQVLLGFLTGSLSVQRAVYGPPGASFDWLGNVYFDHGDGVKEYIGPYRDANGNITDPPGQRQDDCCAMC